MASNKTEINAINNVKIDIVSWQTLIIIQILASSLLAIWARHVSVKTRKSVLAVGLITYAGVAVMGMIYSVVYNRSFPPLPTGQALLYIVAEGLFIPLAWVFQFKLISYIGASNATISNTLNSLGSATLGLILLRETLSLAFVVGTLLIMAGVYFALNIKPDKTHTSTAKFQTKLLLLVGAFVFFSLGMFFEKKALNAIGPWDYMAYGWSMQFVGASVLYAIFGRGQLAFLNKKILPKAVLLGVMTSIAGLLFVLALSKGSLSHTIIAYNARIAVVMVFAAIFLGERNDIIKRIIAFCLAILGIYCIMI